MREEFTFPSGDGRTTVYAVERVPLGTPKAVLQITHGMVEYIGRYRPFADFLEKNGFVVVGNDLVGHGRSVVSDEEHGFFREKDPDGLLVGDMQKLREITQKKYPDIPYFMLGHSMGSYLLREYLTEYAEGLAGAILLGTGYIPESTTRFGLTIVGILSMMHGSHYRSAFVQNLSYSKPYKQYDLTGKNPENSWLTKDTEVVKKYYQDPYCTFLFTLNGYRGLMYSVRKDCRQENVDRIKKDIPILIASGADDPVGDLGEGVRKVEEMFRSAKISDLTVRLYENDRHEILNETDKERVFSDILNWMEKRIPEGKKAE